MKTQMLKRLSSFILMGVLIATLIPAFVASAADWDFVTDGDYKLVVVPSTFTSYFYRVGTANSDENFAYGYGYGYSGGTKAYGYGYGYGYGYFQELGNASNLVAGNFYAGFFTSGGTLSATTTLPSVSSGATTLSFPVTLGGGTAAGSITGVKVLIPATTMTGSNSSWTGALTASSGTTIPSGLAVSSGNVVTLDPGISGMTITLADEAVIKIPSSTFSGLAVQLVQILDGAGAVYTASACSSTQFTGDSTSTTDLENSAKYTLSNPSTDVFGAHCYVFYNPTGTADDAIFVATRHFSSFAAGLGTASTTASSSSGGGGGGGSSSGALVATTTKTKTPVDKTTLTDKPSTTEYFDAEGKGLTVNNFADLAGVAQTDWRFKTVERIAPTGLFQGENVNGKRMFNMTSGMNRAMSAMVVARYVGCDVDAAASENPFSDVKKDAWYASAVGCLKEMGVVNGKTPTVYAPGDLVTRAEFFKLMTEAYMALYPEVETEWRTAMGSAKATFADVKASDWYAGYVNFAYEKGLLNGYVEDGKRYAKGNQTVIRIEAAKMVVNYLDL